jgi:hypothetical protein
VLAANVGFIFVGQSIKVQEVTGVLTFVSPQVT